MKPGEYLLREEPVIANQNRLTVRLVVSNTGDRPIQVGSHFHFMEVNRALSFDREKALGTRLNIPSGTAVRFEPGQAKEVELVAIAGDGMIYGQNRLVEGNIKNPSTVKDALKKSRQWAKGQ